MKRLMLRDHEIVTIPISDEAQRAFEEFIAEHLDEIAERFAPFGLDPREVAAPRLRQPVWEDVPEPHDSGSER